MDLLKMALQMTGLCESFVTHLTPKRWLASGVGAMMSRQIAGSGKPFVTDFARKWFLSGVEAVMYRQKAGT